LLAKYNDGGDEVPLTKIYGVEVQLKTLIQKASPMVKFVTPFLSGQPAGNAESAMDMHRSIASNLAQPAPSLKSEVSDPTLFSLVRVITPLPPAVSAPGSSRKYSITSGPLKLFAIFKLPRGM
jgi:hypothetical protein